jgi:hypothetical protein
MTPFTVSKAINTRFISNWVAACARASAKSIAQGGAAIPTVPYTVDNIRAQEGNALFARLRIVSLTSNQRTLGPRQKRTDPQQKGARRSWEHTGLIEVRITGPLNVGRGEGDLLAGEVRELFQGVRFGNTVGRQGITTEETEINELQRDKESPHRWILLCSTPFSYIERG